jgi:hypothetical protein
MCFPFLLLGALDRPHHSHGEFARHEFVEDEIGNIARLLLAA